MEEDLVLPNSIDAPVNYSQLDTPSIELQPVQASAYVPVTPLTRDKKQISPEEEASALRNKLNRIEVQDPTLDPAKTDSYSINKDRYNGFIIDPTKDQDFDLQASGQQTWVDRVMNDTVVFGAGLASGFGAAFTSIADMVKEQSFTPGVDSITASLADWKTEVDENHINFETQYDRDHPYLSMVLPAIFTGSSKGWGDMARSLSIGVGTGVGILTQQALLALATEGTGNVPALAATMRGVLSMRTGATAASMVGRLAQTVKAGTQAMNATQKGLLAADLTKEVAQRYLMSMGEAEFEANETRVNFRANYIQDFVRKNGRIPTGDELVNVEDVAEKAHDARYTLNMATLMVTGGPFMKGVLKPLQSTRAFQDKLVEKGMVASLELAENSAGKIVFSKGKNLVGDFWINNKIGKVLKTPAEAILKNKSFITSIQGMEAIEEGLQFLYDKSVDNYYTSYLDNKTNGRVKDSILETALGIGKQLYKDKGLLTSQEGIQSMISGVFAGTGQAMFTKALGQFKMGRDENGKYGIRYTGAKEREQYKADLESAGDNILEKISDVIGNHKSLKQTPLQSIQDVGSVATLDNMLGFTTHDIIQEQIRSKRVFDSLFSLVKTGQNEVALDILKKDMSSLSPVQFGQLLGVNITTEEEKRNLIESTTDSFNAVSKSYNRVQSIFRPPLSVAKSPEKSLIYNQLKDALTYHEYTATNLEGQITNRTSKSPLIVSTPESVAYMNGDVDFFKKLKKSKQDMMTAFNAIMPEAAPKDLTSQKDRVQGELDFIDDIIATIDEVDNKDAILDTFSKVAAITGTPFKDVKEAEEIFKTASDIKYLVDKHKEHIRTFDALVSAKPEDMIKVYTDYVLKGKALNDAIEEIVTGKEPNSEPEELLEVEELPEEEAEQPQEEEKPEQVVVAKETDEQIKTRAALKTMFDAASKTKFVDKTVNGVLESFYKLKNKIYKRVTNFIDPTGIVFETEESVTNVKNSHVVGNVVDIIARGVFQKESFSHKNFLKVIEGDKSSFTEQQQEQFKYLKSEEVFKKVKEQVLEAKKRLVANHTVVNKIGEQVLPTFITDELFASIDRKVPNADGVGGKTDMLLIDGDGKLFIYDFKNVILQLDSNGDMIPYDPSTRENVERGIKWTKQQTVYAAFVEKATGIRPSINILVFGTNYTRPGYKGALDQESRENFYPQPSDLKIKFQTPIELPYDPNNVEGLPELLAKEPVKQAAKYPDYPKIVGDKIKGVENTLESKVGASIQEVKTEDVINGIPTVSIKLKGSAPDSPEFSKAKKNYVRKLKTAKNLKLNFKQRVIGEGEQQVFNQDGDKMNEPGLMFNNDVAEPSYVLTYLDEETGVEFIVGEAKHPKRLTINPISLSWLKDVLPSESFLRAFVNYNDEVTLYDLYKQAGRDLATIPEIKDIVGKAIWKTNQAANFDRAYSYVTNYFESYDRFIKDLADSSFTPEEAFRNNFELDYIGNEYVETAEAPLIDKMMPLELVVDGNKVYFEGLVYQGKKFFALKENKFKEISDVDTLKELERIVYDVLNIAKPETASLTINSFKTYENLEAGFKSGFIYRVESGASNAVELFERALEEAKKADPKNKFKAFKDIIVIKDVLNEPNTTVTIRDNDVAISVKSKDPNIANKPIKTISIENDKIIVTDKVTGEKTPIKAYDPSRSISPEDFVTKSDYKNIFPFVRPIVKASGPSSNSTINTAKTAPVISDKEYSDFIDNGVVSQKTITSIANKVKNNEKLSDREMEIFTDKTSEINTELEILNQKSDPYIENLPEELRAVAQKYINDIRILYIPGEDTVDIDHRGEGIIGDFTPIDQAEAFIEKYLGNNLKNESLDVSLPPEQTSEDMSSDVEEQKLPVQQSTKTQLVFTLETTIENIPYVYDFVESVPEDMRQALNEKLNSYSDNGKKGRALKVMEASDFVYRRKVSAPAQRNEKQIGNIEEEIKNLKKQCHGLS